MIYYNFIVDYLISFFTPFNSYLIINRIEKNKFIDVVIVSLLIDLMFKKPPLNLLILSAIYILSKKIHISKKYLIIKELICYMVYFNISFFIYTFDLYSYFGYFMIGLVFNLSYSLLLSNKHIVM